MIKGVRITAIVLSILIMTTAMSEIIMLPDSSYNSIQNGYEANVSVSGQLTGTQVTPDLVMKIGNMTLTFHTIEPERDMLAVYQLGAEISTLEFRVVPD